MFIGLTTTMPNLVPWSEVGFGGSIFPSLSNLIRFSFIPCNLSSTGSPHLEVVMCQSLTFN